MLRRMAGFVARQSWLRKAVVSTPLVRGLAWRFVAGEDLDAGLATARALNARGLKATLNCVGAHVRDEAEAVAAADAAVASLRRIRDEGLDANVSLKLTQIGLDIDEGLCRDQLRRVLECAAEVGNFVRIDMEESPYVERTLRLFEEVRASYGDDTVGVVIQSYLKGRRGDLRPLLESGARVRLVKGGYWEPPDVAYRSRADVDRAFGEEVELLLTRGRRPALATHDPVFIERGRSLAEAAGLGRKAFEFQMLYGVRRDLQERLAAEGYAVRCYVPYGRQWYAYFLGCVRRVPGGLLRRLGERARPAPPRPSAPGAGVAHGP